MENFIYFRLSYLPHLLCLVCLRLILYSKSNIKVFMIFGRHSPRLCNSITWNSKCKWGYCWIQNVAADILRIWLFSSRITVLRFMCRQTQVLSAVRFCTIHLYLFSRNNPTVSQFEVTKAVCHECRARSHFCYKWPLMYKVALFRVPVRFGKTAVVWCRKLVLNRFVFFSDPYSEGWRCAELVTVRLSTC